MADAIETVTTDKSHFLRITSLAKKMCLANVTHSSEECFKSDISLSSVAERPTPANDGKERGGGRTRIKHFSERFNFELERC